MSRIDREKIVVIGHSMGGFVAAHIVAANPALLGACLISGVALGPVFGAPGKDHAVVVIGHTVGASEGLHILAGTSPEALAEEAGKNMQLWNLENYA